MQRFKGNVLLYMYNILKEGKIVRKQDILSKFKLNERTFYRYIEDIKNFVQSPDSELIGEQVNLDKEKGGYTLEGNAEKNLSEKEVLAISKVLLESRGLVKDEIESIINKLLKCCVCEDKKDIKHIIGNELINYVSPRHEKKLLDNLWKISTAIKEQRILNIEYFKLGLNGKLKKDACKKTLYPQGLLFSEYYFYLIAFIKGKKYEYPTIYRVDRIKDLVVTEEKYKVEYSKRFQEGEFRKLIQFMQTGDLQKIRFRFTRASIEAILDRLPNAKVLKEGKGEYIVETNMFGKGIKMWLLSQGEFVEVLEPKEFREDVKGSIDKMEQLYLK